MEDKKNELPVLITPGAMQLKINTQARVSKLTIGELEKRALELVKNHDSLKTAADLLKDTKSMRDIAKEVHETVKKPFWDAGKACDAGKKLVFDELDRIESMFLPWYKKELDDIAEEKRLANLKAAQDAAIQKGIEDNVMTFSNMIVAAVTRKQLREVESRINLEKSPSRSKKYGEFHQVAIQRYDTLLPKIREQKETVEKIEKLNSKLLEAEANNDPETMDTINAQIEGLSNEMLQTHAEVQEEALNQESFPVVEGTEVLPGVRTKRTNASFEIVDVEKAFKHMRSLLDIEINGKAAREEFRALMEAGEFEGKDEVIKHGIKFIATRVREAL